MLREMSASSYLLDISGATEWPILSCADPHDGLPRGVELASDLCNEHALSQQAQHLTFLRIGQCRRPAKPYAFGPGSLNAAVSPLNE